jgi:hypothetical protein
MNGKADALTTALVLHSPAEPVHHAHVGAKLFLKVEMRKDKIANQAVKRKLTRAFAYLECCVAIEIADNLVTKVDAASCFDTVLANPLTIITTITSPP